MKDIFSPERDLKACLRARGVSPTAQRMQIAEVLFSKPAHFSADEIYSLLKTSKTMVSKATVYNTLGLFVEKGLIKEVLVDPSKVFYDSNTSPHHHFYDVDSGEIQDIEDNHIVVDSLPQIPSGKQLERVEVLLRVRQSGS